MKEILKQELKNAMKEKNVIKKNTLQLVLAGITNKEKDLLRDIDETEQLAIIQKEIKQTEDSLEGAKKANREDLAKEAEIKIDILKSFLPKQLSEDEVSLIINKYIIEGMTMKDMGKIMSLVKEETTGKADNRLVSQLVKKALS